MNPSSAITTVRKGTTTCISNEALNILLEEIIYLRKRNRRLSEEVEIFRDNMVKINNNIKIYCD